MTLWSSPKTWLCLLNWYYSASLNILLYDKDCKLNLWNLYQIEFLWSSLWLEKKLLDMDKKYLTTSVFMILPRINSQQTFLSDDNAAFLKGDTFSTATDSDISTDSYICYIGSILRCDCYLFDSYSSWSCYILNFYISKYTESHICLQERPQQEYQHFFTPSCF